MRRLLWIFPTLLFTFQLTQIICEPGGIGKVHFKWPVDVVERVYDELRLLTIWWLPLLLAAAIAHNLAPQTGSEALGRLLLLLVLLVLGYHLGAPQVRELRNVGTVWFRSTLNRLRMLLSGVLLLALYAILVGQVFSVTVVIGVLINTFWIGVFLLLVNSILLRWLRVARRHLRLSELLAQRSEQGEEETASVEEKVPDLVEVSTETQQLITFASIVTAALSLFYVWAPLLPALEGLNRVTLWTSSSVVDGETITNSITATTLIVVLALGMFTLFAAQRLPALVEIVLRSRTSVTPGARYTVSTLLNYVIIGAGLIAGLSALGLKWGQLQWLVAALGVGIGFGLQEIVANFISGLIILFERPIRVGDIVTIGDKDGRVVRIRIRATTIRDWEGKELLVPNKEFITGRLLNWTLSDSQNRLEIPVGIAYGSDVDKALQILETTVRENPSVLSDPAPSILFLGFGDNSLNLSARVFISKIDERMPILSELHKAINSAFNEAGIVIAFPQRDVHFDADKPLRIAMEPRSEPGS